eukprot:7122267-Prorocentrum_lima.AAC.1
MGRSLWNGSGKPVDAVERSSGISLVRGHHNILEDGRLFATDAKRKRRRKGRWKAGKTTRLG